MKAFALFSRWGLSGLAIALVLAVTGCSSTSGSGDAGGTPGMVGSSSTNPPPLLDEGDSQTLQAGDTLFISYFDLPQPVPPVEVQIRPDGTITLMENQVFKAEGLTHTQLEQEIRKRYVPAYFRSLTPVIKPKEDTRLYFVGGEVRAPGGQFYRSKTTLIKAIQSAGDFTDYANKRAVELTRSGATKPIMVNANKARVNPALDLEVFPGDRIHVPRRVLW